jgi:hypothetical protein
MEIMRSADRPRLISNSKFVPTACKRGDVVIRRSSDGQSRRNRAYKDGQSESDAHPFRADLSGRSPSSAAVW